MSIGELIYSKLLETISDCCIENIVKEDVSEGIIQQYQEQIVQRIDLLQRVPDANNFFYLYNVLVPEVFCRDLVRVGSVGDGGKWICNPLSMKEFSKCTIYSLGIHNEPSFDESIQKLFNNKCMLRAVDKGDQTEKTLGRITSINGVFTKAFIGSVSDPENDKYTIGDIMKKYNDTRIDFLKIDIEGHEHAIAEELVSIPLCQIFIEIHSRSAKKTLDLLKKFSKNGFYLFSYEINGALHYLSEYSFIHKSCLEDFHVNTVYGKYLS